MNLHTMTLNMGLAAYLAPKPTKHIIRMAKRYRKHSKNTGVKAALTFLIKSPTVRDDILDLAHKHVN